MKPLPDRVVSCGRTQEFSEATLPHGLRHSHSTKSGVWGRICVLEGELLYRILEPAPQEVLLTPGQPGIIEPAVLHEVEPRGPLRFFIEFLK